jgi:hypothetical protein
LWNVNECGKTEIMRISRQASPLQIMIDQKQLENVKCFNCLDSMIASDARYTHKIKSRIAVVKAAVGV